MSATQVKTGEVRFSYVRVFEKDDNGKMSVSLLIPKSDTKTVARINAAVQAAYEEGKGKLGKTSFKVVKKPLRDGDTEKDAPEYEGHYFMNCSTKRKPGIVDANLEEIIDPDEFYSGCYGRAQVNMYAFAVDGNKGIACGLNFLQKLRDGEPLAGPGTTAAAVFADDEEDEDLMG